MGDTGIEYKHRICEIVPLWPSPKRLFDPCLIASGDLHDAATLPEVERNVLMLTSMTNQNTHPGQVAFVLCGALAREVIAIVRRHGWDVALFGVAASDHMLPVRIA